MSLKLPSDNASIKIIVNFNSELRRLADLLKNEFSHNMIVRRSHAKLMTALKMNNTLAYNLFQTHVQPEYGDKIMSGDVDFIEDIKSRYANEKDSEDLLPTVALIWNEGGENTKNPKLLQNMILGHLRNLCKMSPVTAESKASGGKLKTGVKFKTNPTSSQGGASREPGSTKSSTGAPAFARQAANNKDSSSISG